MNDMVVSPDAVAALVRSAAETEILPRFKNLAAGEVREKAPGQIVTDADVAAEKLLADTLTSLLPGAVVGEEGVAEDPTRMQALQRPGPVWVIDPVDGTANFVVGNPRFAVIVALVIDGETKLGLIHDPVADHTVFAMAGQGAWEGGKRLLVPVEKPIAEMTGSAKRRSPLADCAGHVGRRGSAGQDYLDLARGALDFAYYRGLTPWDHAAGVLIHREAQGYGALLGDRPYSPVVPYDERLLLAPGRTSWAALSAAL